MSHVGVLLAAFGGPRDLDEIAPFMASIMGVDPSAQALEDARLKYLTIGGRSPLPAKAERVAVQLERALNGLEQAQSDGEGMGLLGTEPPLERAQNVKIPVVVGMLHSQPSIESAVSRLAASGVRRMVVAPLSPFDSTSTTKAYSEAVAAAAAKVQGITVLEAANYHVSDHLVAVLADNLGGVLQSDDFAQLNPLIVFTAHSLPVAEVEQDPCYVDQLKETAAAVAARASLGPADGFEALPGIDAYGGHSGVRPWLLAFQSKGQRGGEWIGPDLNDVLDAAIEAGFDSIAVSPIGFALDHMETLYDLDVIAAERVLDSASEFGRAPAPNDSSDLIEALAEAVRKVI